MTTPVLGVCYYPEHWPEAWWEDDARRMAEIGIRYVRIGEFAWSKLEPTPGDLRFDWLKRAMDVLGKHGLKVILGTPTATPPRWMLDRHPDMLAKDEMGHVRGFGSRRHYCFSYLPYHEESARITRLLADAFGSHPALAGWQTDNEYGCHATTVSYSAAARAGFQRWLKDKYGSIAALNEAWGAVFWSMEYNDFSQIDLPNLTVTEAAPSARLDFRRYSSDMVAVYNKVQFDILKAARPDLPVIHNFMGRFTEFDHYKVGRDLDVASWDSYPIGHLAVSPADEARKTAYLRQGDPDSQGLQHDIYRAVGPKGRWWVMEQQPGPVNWARYNPDPLPGMARLWAWEAFAHGAEVVSYFRWRQAPFAQEQMHAGLLRPDSEAAPAYFEAKQVAEEIAALGFGGDFAKAKVGIVYDYESVWAWEVQPQAEGFSHHDEVRAAYIPLRQRGVDVDILSPDTRDFSGYDLVIVPALFTWSEALREAVSQFSGHLLIGPRTGSKTENFSIPAALGPDMPRNLLDLKVARVDSSRPDHKTGVVGGGTVSLWRERVETRAEVKLRDVEDYPVLVAQGKLHYLAASGDEVLMQRVIDGLLKDANIPVLNLPVSVRARSHGPFRVYFNYGTTAERLTQAKDEAGYVLGGADIPAAGVTIARLARAG